MTHEAPAAGGIPPAAGLLRRSVEATQRSRYLGQDSGPASECYMVWWLRGFYKPSTMSCIQREGE